MQDNADTSGFYRLRVDALHRRVARRIRALASDRGIVLSHLPDRAGVTRSHFWRVLQGDASPTLVWLQKIATALDSDVEDLVRRRQREL